ncbi:translation initiation factor IF-2 [Trypanosoma grayi]|uniref:translation initiation factor IF-2 n=1 Tax=Trypanosoma grayi TaxID=71804 RepID=UPI0004F404B0|nr:translation initiation factor IF-2 [Trypanosoma grayi]KEG10024.1 translation initiation factor IF-2 [Trypanosoma grayi]
MTDLDSFLNKKSKKLAGGKKKAKTGELSEKERAELGIEVFGGLDGAGTSVLPTTQAMEAKSSGNIDNNNGTVEPPPANPEGAAAPSGLAPVEAGAAGGGDDDGDALNKKEIPTEVAMQVVKTSEKKAKGWEDMKLKSGSVEDLLAKAAEKSGARKFVARGNGEATGTLARGINLSSADLPTLEDVVSGNVPVKKDPSPELTQATASPTTKAEGGSYKPPTDRPSAGAYKPPTDRPSAGAYKPPTDRPSAGAYKPPTDRPSAGAYKPPTDRPSQGAEETATDKPSEGTYKPPTDRPSAGAYKPPTDRPSTGAYKPPTDRPSAGAYKPPTDRPSAGAYKPPTDRPSAGVYKPPNRNNAASPS